MSDLILDASRSRVRIQTFAEGLLSRLAHDLELLCGELSGTATISSAGGKTTGTARIEAPLRGVVVAGVLGKDGRVDPRALSANEQRDILEKMQHDVFHAGPDAVVRVEAQHDGASARIRIHPPNGKAVETVVRPDVDLQGDAVHAKGAFELSLAAMGSDAVKGPMGAFRVKDRVKVLFDVWFARAPRVE